MGSPLLIAATLIFSVATISSGLAVGLISLATLPWILTAVAVLACRLTLGLRETAPKRVAGLPA